MIPIAVWIGGGIASLLGLARLHKVAVDKKAAAAATAAQPPPATPAQVAAVTPTQVAAAATSAGVTVAQLATAAANAGTTPQAVIAAAQAAGSSVADAILAAANGTPGSGAPAPPGVIIPPGSPGSSDPDPSLQAQVNPGQTARVTTNDPPPNGDLAIRAQPDDASPIIGAAEKDGVLVITDINASPTYAAVSWPGGSRLPPVTGFAHKQFLNTNFNGDGFTDPSEA